MEKFNNLKAYEEFDYEEEKDDIVIDDAERIRFIIDTYEFGFFGYEKENDIDELKRKIGAFGEWLNKHFKK